MRRLVVALLAWAFFLGLALPAAAQAPSPELRARAEQLVALLRGGGNPADLFTTSFLDQVPETQLRSVARQLTAQYGEVQGLARVEPQSATAALLHFDYARAAVRMNMVIEPQAPYRISGLLVTGADMRDDSLAALLAEIEALPGEASVAVARLGDGAPELLAAAQPDRPLAIGSAFKLFILAELSRQVQAGERRWDEVVALDRRSIPSGLLQTWPRGAPITLHSLAALMISQSDNTAADALLHALGRDRVERMMTTIGVEAAARNRPLLSTLELAALKTAPEATIEAWRGADEAGRRALLAGLNADAARIDIARFTGAPLRVDIEWFASAADLVRTMDWLRRHGDDTARAILAINPGVPPAVAGELDYLGYKGGSEPGVLNLTWLVRNRAGAWHVVTGSWNNPAAPVEETRFVGLMTRAIRLVR